MQKQEAQAEHAAWQAQVNADAYIPVVVAARYVSGYTVWLHFNDGTEGVADLSALIYRPGKFKDLADMDYFRTVFYDSALQTIAWPNGLDLSPESLYERVKHAEGAK